MDSQAVDSQPVEMTPAEFEAMHAECAGRAAGKIVEEFVDRVSGNEEEYVSGIIIDAYTNPIDVLNRIVEVCNGKRIVQQLTDQGWKISIEVDSLAEARCICLGKKYDPEALSKVTPPDPDPQPAETASDEASTPQPEESQSDAQPAETADDEQQE